MTSGWGRLAGAAAATGLALVVLRSAGSRIGTLAALPGPPHESSLRDRLMVDLGTTSRNSGNAASLKSQMAALAARSPLAPEPFLVGGAIAELHRDDTTARRLYDSALRRDPRSRAAHFMLARQAFLNGANRRGLRHLISLSRLSPGAAPEVGKVLMGLAADPGFDALVRQFLADEPDQADPLFLAMTDDAGLADRIFRLAPARPRGAAAYPWAAKMVGTLLAAGDIDRAANAWVRFAGQADPRSTTLRDGRFDTPSGPPFGWQFEGGDGGSVARGKTGLDIETFGDTPVRLASQTLLLPPGRYRLASRGQFAAGALRWHVTCPGQQPTIIPAGVRGEFVIGPGCPSQSIELWSAPSNEGGDETAHLTEVRIDRVAP